MDAVDRKNDESGGGQAAGFTVSELCRSIEAAVSDAFPEEVWVRGVISGLSRSANGHVYFDLVDPNTLGSSPEATLPVALFANAKQRVNAILRKTNAARMADGIEIRIRGSVSYYSRQGRVQLIMSLIDPAYTLGQLELAKTALLAELASEDLLEANGRIPFPVLPLRIGLVTSLGSAAEADFLNEISGSGFPFEITVFDSRVQGSDAIAELPAALEQLAEGEPVDVIAIVRGGGARTDLAAFDHADVARAIAVCPIPVVVGIGHEIDSSVADSVAARSAKTPTACASLLVDQVRGVQQRVDRCAERIGFVAQRQMERQHARLETSSQRLVTAARRRLDGAAHQLERATLTIDALDPAKALARGWTITRRTDGTLVRSIDSVVEGEELVTTTVDGTVLSATLSTLPEPGPQSPDAEA